MATEDGYSDEEVALIMQRAVELQAEQGSERRLTIAEVEAVAREAGIDKALVRRAAAELAVTEPSSRSRDSFWLGAPKRVTVETVVPEELSARQFEDLVQRVRDVVGDTGEVKTVGRTQTWETRVPAVPAGQIGVRRVVLTVIPRDGVTRIRLEENLGHTAGALFGGLLGGLGGGGVSMVIVPLLVHGLGWLAPFAGIAWVGGVYALVRRIYRSKARSREQQLRALLRELASLSQAAPQPGLDPSKPG